MRKVSSLLVASLTLTLALAACGGGSKKSTTPKTTATKTDTTKKSLYDRLGGVEAIKLVVADFLKNVIADDRINGRFQNTKPDELGAKLVDQICMATGGPCKYTGKSMVEAHTGMNVTEDEFAALVEDLVKSLDALKVPQAEKDELLGALGGMKGDIVGK